MMKAMDALDPQRALYLPDGDGFIGTLRTQGGWHPNQQHGGPVQALMARAIEAFPALVPMQVSRLTHDLFRPVPIGPRLTIEVDVLREGKRIQLLEAVLRVGDVEHVRTRALRLRDGDMSAVGERGIGMGDDPADVTAPTVPWAEELADTDFSGTANVPGFMEGMSLRRILRAAADGAETGDFNGWWIRLRGPLVAGESPTPLQRLSVTGDFANMIGRMFDARNVSAINPDLNLHVLRLPVGEWVAVVGETRLALPTGQGVSTAQLRDRDGICGMAANSVLLQYRQPLVG